MMKSNQLVKYPKGTEVEVHYPDGAWLCIASFAFGAVCWYLGYLGALAGWLQRVSLVLSYLFFVALVAIAFFWIRFNILLLDRKQNWLVNPDKRLATQLVTCCILPTVFLFAVIRPVAIPRDEWLLLPLLVIFGAMLLLNMLYTLYFYWTIYHRRGQYIMQMERKLLHQDIKIASLQDRIDLQSPALDERTDSLNAEPQDRDSDTTDEIDLVMVRSIDPVQHEFLIRNKFVTKKILYSELGLFVFENANNTPLIMVHLRSEQAGSTVCEQRSLNEIVRDTKGFVQKIDRYHAVPLHMIDRCFRLKGGRLRILVKDVLGERTEFVVSAKIAKRIKDWVMLQVPIIKE